jgi:hypothetical protein
MDKQEKIKELKAKLAELNKASMEKTITTDTLKKIEDLEKEIKQLESQPD